MKKLYIFTQDYGRMGSLEGLFIAKESEIEKLIGKEIYYGEVLGKHSEIFGILQWEHLKVTSEDQDFINKLANNMGGNTISGFNPLDYYEPEEEIKKLYKFYISYHGMGIIEGLFISDETKIDELIGKELNFNGLLGEYSEIEYIFNKEDLEILSEDQDFITKCEEILGDTTICGINPLEYYYEDE